MFGKSKLPSAIKAMWEAEDALTLAQRRERYKCRKAFTKAEDIIRWESYKTTTPPLDHTTRVSENKIHETFVHKLLNLKGPNIFAKYKEDPIINSKVALWAGNITTLEIDAILNAANNSMTGGGGVDGAIHAAAGKELYNECKLHNGCPTGEAKITRGYRLPAKYVIATAGPVGEKPQMLYNSYYNSLEVAKRNGVRTFALCGVSSGIYGYPLFAATHIALATVRKWLKKNKKHVDLIIFCNYLPKEVACYESLMPLYFPRSSVIPPRPIPDRKKGEEREEEGEEGEEGKEGKEEEEEEDEYEDESSGVKEEKTEQNNNNTDASNKESHVKAEGEAKVEGEVKDAKAESEVKEAAETKAESGAKAVEGEAKTESKGEENKDAPKSEESADVNELATSLAGAKI